MYLNISVSPVITSRHQTVDFKRRPRDVASRHSATNETSRWRTCPLPSGSGYPHCDVPLMSWHITVRVTCALVTNALLRRPQSPGSHPCLSFEESNISYLISPCLRMSCIPLQTQVLVTVLCVQYVSSCFISQYELPTSGGPSSVAALQASSLKA